MEGIGVIVALVVLLVVALTFVFWIWMLIECLTKEPDTGNNKVVWALVIVLTHIIGALIYYFVRRPQRYAEVGR